MARTGRPKARLEVTAVERGELERLARRARTNRHVALRAKIVLRCARGESNVAVAAKRCSNVTVVASGVTTGRVDALYDEPKPGAPRTLPMRMSWIVATLESKPKGRPKHPQDGGARWRHWEDGVYGTSKSVFPGGARACRGCEEHREAHASEWAVLHGGAEARLHGGDAAEVGARTNARHRPGGLRKACVFRRSSEVARMVRRVAIAPWRFIAAPDRTALRFAGL